MVRIYEIDCCMELQECRQRQRHLNAGAKKRILHTDEHYCASLMQSVPLRPQDLCHRGLEISSAGGGLVKTSVDAPKKAAAISCDCRLYL